MRLTTYAMTVIAHVAPMIAHTAAESEISRSDAKITQTIVSAMNKTPMYGASSRCSGVTGT